MTAAAEPIGARLARRWRDPAAWMTTTDIVAVLLAASLPWSTSLVGIFAVAVVLVMLPTLDAGAFFSSLKRPISAVPIALFLLALIGTLWSDARWGMRFYAVAPTAKFLLLPLLFYHFERSQRGLWVLIAFLASCVALLAMSWLVTLETKRHLLERAQAEDWRLLFVHDPAVVGGRFISGEFKPSLDPVPGRP